MITIVMSEWFTWLMVIVTGWYIVDSLLGMHIRYLNRKLLKINERKKEWILDELNSELQGVIKILNESKPTGDRHETKN